MKPEYIRTSLKRMWLEDFYEFCEEEVIYIQYIWKLNSTSQDLMIDLLKFEADFKTI